jgi:hypothetical protein
VIKIRSQKEQDRPFNLLAWGHWFAFGNFILALALSLSYIAVSPAPETFIGWGYLLFSWVGHFAFLSLAGFIITIFPFIIIFPNRKHIRGFAAIVASILQVLLFLDVLAFQGLGYHLSSVSLGQLKEVEDVYTTSMGDAYWLLLLFVLASVLTYQFIISNYTWKRIYQLQAWPYKNTLARSLLACFLASHVIHLWADAAYNTDVARQTNLFPLSYPLTAKTLLAKYELLDLDEYKVSRSRSAQVNSSLYITKDITQVSCDVNSAPKLDVVVINEHEYNKVRNWLSKYNVRFSSTNQLHIPTDLDSLIYNFNTGLPGLYRELPAKQSHQINDIFNQELVSVSLYNGEFDLNKKYRATENKRIFVFLPDTDAPFTTANAIMIGFKMNKGATLIPQNIIASYIEEELNCPEFRAHNLIDSAISKLQDDYLFANYSNEHLALIFKDKSMVFHKGELKSITTLSSRKNVEEYLDLNVLKLGVEKITQHRVKIKQ